MLNGAELMVSNFRMASGLRDSSTRFPIPAAGDMVFFKVLGQPFLILNSLKRTNDLFEKRSSNYSDRKSGTMLIEL